MQYSTYAFAFIVSAYWNVHKVSLLSTGQNTKSHLHCSWLQRTNNLIESRHDKTNKLSVRPAKTQISLGIRPVWSESSLSAQRVAKDPRFLHADSENSDLTGRMPRLIWNVAGRTLILLVLSCRGSVTWTRTCAILGFDSIQKLTFLL